MVSKNMIDFLGVKWYDGLLVSRDHLFHHDSRMIALLSDVYSSAVEQPGILQIDARSSVAGRLVEIEGVKKAGEGGGIDIAFDIQVPFRAITFDGSIVTVLPNRKGSTGVPVTDVVARSPADSPGVRTLLVCARQADRLELAVRRAYTPDRPIELLYPGIEIELIGEERFISELHTEFMDATPIARIRVEGERAELDAVYIPPLVRLQHVDFFDTGLIAEFNKIFAELLDVSAQYLAAGGHVFSREGVSPELRTRYNFYHVLNAMLMGKSGLLRNIAVLSPFRFYYEVMCPLTRWFDQYYPSLGERQSSIMQVSQACAKVRDMKHGDLCAGSDKLLGLSREFVHRINETIKEIA